MRSLLSAATAASLALSLALSSPALPQTVTMEPFPEPDTNFQVIGGKPAKPADWPATVIFRSSGGMCTSTIIGEKVLLTAAHCVANGAKATVIYGGVEREVECTHHKDYRGESCSSAKTAEETAGCTADIALCFPTGKNGKEKDTFPTSFASFERLRAPPQGPKQGDRLKLLGWGCTVAGGSLSPILLESEPDPTVLYGSTPGASKGAKSKSLLEYIKTSGGNAVCKGDSGGAVYSKVGTQLVIEGVVSRGNMSTDSYISSVSDEVHRAWIESLTTNKERYVCGLGTKATNCRK